MKKFLILLSLSLVLSFNSYSQLSRGCLSEQRDTTLTQKRHFSKGGSSNLPSSYSLEKFAPPVLSQGNLSSCTAWSSAYCALTIVKRMETANLSFEPFSPLNLYNRLKAVTSEDPCHAGGCYVSDALNMLEDHGCAKFSDMANTCGYTSASKYYSDKLYGFEELGVTTDNIKTALTKNSPVVFVIQYYNDSWGEEKNHNSGVWNGHYGSADGYHAMCIIGYDDNLSGGAFQVQNSWGDDWGQNGYFWIKYKDISHIDQAFMVKADPTKVNETFIANNTNGTNNNTNNTNDNTDITDNTNNNNTNNTDNTDNTNNNTDNTNWNGTDEQVFRVYNECSVTAYVAISQYEDGAWVNRGWYATQPGRYIDLEIGNRGQDDIYWLAINNANDLVWQDSENGTDMCYDPTDAFTIYDNANPDCPKYKKFFKESPGFEYEVYTQTLTCPSLDGSRDNSRDRNRDNNGDNGDNNNRRRDLNTDNSLGTNVLDHRHDDRDADVANYSWQKGTLLFDLYSKSIIHSTTNRNGDIMYHIYYIDSDNQVREANLTEDRLVSLQAYKFESRENAERWLSSK